MDAKRDCLPVFSGMGLLCVLRHAVESLLERSKNVENKFQQTKNI